MQQRREVWKWADLDGREELIPERKFNFDFASFTNAISNLVFHISENFHCIFSPFSNRIATFADDLM